MNELSMMTMTNGMCNFFPACKREVVERELAAHDYLLRDRGIDRLSHEN